MKEYYDNDLLNQIKYLIDNNRQNAAIKKINEYKEKYPNDNAVEIYNVKILINNKDFIEAEKLCTELLKQRFHNEFIYHNVLYSLGEIYQFSKRTDEAIEVFKRLDKISNHEMPQAIIKLSIIYIDNKKINEAKELLSKRYNFEYDPRIEIKKAEIAEPKHSN